MNWPFFSLASWLRWWTRKQREQVNSSACRGMTRTVNSSSDRSAPGSSSVLRQLGLVDVDGRGGSRRAAPSAPRGCPRRARRRSCAGCRNRLPPEPPGHRSSGLVRVRAGRAGGTTPARPQVCPPGPRIVPYRGRTSRRYADMFPQADQRYVTRPSAERTTGDLQSMPG